MKIICIVAARPNFMKVAPVHAALRRHGHVAPLVHTGQHYDANMSDIFFTQLGMPRPDISLGIGSGTHAQQTARIMEAFEPVLEREAPDWLLVAGDVNSTLACALVASKRDVKIAHLEAGLRSYDRRMPEEINRVLVDHMSEALLTPSPDAEAHLLAEGVDPSHIHPVGNAMIDSLLAHRDKALALGVAKQEGVEPGHFALVTLHRPVNVDAPEALAHVIEILAQVSRRLPVLFPVHPRTRQGLATPALERLLGSAPDLRLLQPLGYLEFLGLQAQAQIVLTDSGGVQEETTALGVPCLTMREGTERPITVTEGTNTVVGVDRAVILAALDEVLAHGGKRGRVPALWDGKTGERVAAVFDRLK